MIKLRTIILGLVLALVILQSQSNANPVIVDLTQGNYTIPDANGMWQHIDVLNISNGVTVTMPVGLGGGIYDFNMYGNSQLVMYGRYISHELNLYDNATASLFGGSQINHLYVDSESTGWVKLYAYDVTFAPPAGPADAGHIRGWWLAENNHFDITLIGDDTLSRIQIVPEPATLALIGIGILALRRRK